MRHKRHTAPRPVLAGVGALGGQGVGDQHPRLGAAVAVVAVVCPQGWRDYEGVLLLLAASPSSARRKGSGNVRSLRSARRRMPAAARGVRKYLGGTGDVSKMSDNEDATASLGHSEELSIQTTPFRLAIPAEGQAPDNFTHPVSDNKSLCGLTHSPATRRAYRRAPGIGGSWSGTSGPFRFNS